MSVAEPHVVTQDVPRDRLDPPALTTEAQRIHDEVVAEWNAEQLGDIHERFADWVRSKLTVDELCAELIDQYTQVKLRRVVGQCHLYALQFRKRHHGSPWSQAWDCVPGAMIAQAFMREDGELDPLVETWLEDEWLTRCVEAGERVVPT